VNLVIDYNKIKSIFLFSDLEDSDLEKIKSFASFKKFKKGEILFFDSEPYRGFYCVLDGAIKLYKISPEGREHIIHIVYPGNIFAEVPLFDNFNEIKKNEVVYPINAMALDDENEVIIIPALPFMEILEKDKTICMKMLANFSRRLKIMNKHIASVTLQDVKKRLAQYILSEYENSKTNLKPDILTHHKSKTVLKEYIELSISKYDLASLLGTILETLSRTFKKLQEEKVIEVEGKRIYILNPAKLKTYNS
jgi:CRP/FNR family transcriptional regulator